MKALALLIILAASVLTAFSKTSGFPDEDILVVIKKARAFIESEKLDTTNYFIQKVEFKHQYEELVPQFWEITFTKVPRIKGGYIIIHVYNDGSVKPYFGE
jgi:hypothetical protein